MAHAFTKLLAKSFSFQYIPVYFQDNLPNEHQERLGQYKIPTDKNITCKQGFISEQLFHKLNIWNMENTMKYYMNLFPHLSRNK